MPDANASLCCCCGSIALLAVCALLARLLAEMRIRYCWRAESGAEVGREAERGGGPGAPPCASPNDKSGRTSGMAAVEAKRRARE